MRQVDLVFYQNLIQVLVPDVLKPIPATLTQSIRNFAKSKSTKISRIILFYDLKRLTNVRLKTK